MLELCLAHPAVEVELGEGLLDEVQTAQVGMARAKRVKASSCSNQLSPASSGDGGGAGWRRTGQVLPQRVSTSNMGKAR